MHRAVKLTDTQRRLLRSLAHDRKPIVTIGRKGLGDSVLRELDLALAHHELVKVKINIADRTARNSAIQTLCEASSAILVQRIGFIATLYRANPEHPHPVLAKEPE